VNVIQALSEQFCQLGYSPRTLARNYRFADMLDPAVPVRTVPLVAFTDTPHSYRNAALGVLAVCGDAGAAIQKHRALGVTTWFCIQGEQVQIWNTHGPRGPVCEGVRPMAELEQLFQQNRERWAPDRIHHAKLVGLWDAADQPDLVGFGLLKDIEVRIQERLDAVITCTLKTLVGKSSQAIDYQRAYRACFYFLAAKVVLDRGHAVGRKWPVDDAQGVLEAISTRYQLDYASEPGRGIPPSRLQQAWGELRNDVSFANISVDDLAFVYEHTLVSKETRKRLGTHSTPRAVAEYLVSRLDLGRYRESVPLIYEPFCGSGVLLVAALSKLRSHLPRDWSDAQRHAFLTRRLRGADVDRFACEVASLSLVLADYPSSNGWDIRATDLFKGQELTEQLDVGSIVLCNPPFETFDAKERGMYSQAAATSVHKPIQVLESVLSRRPQALGFVMPQAILGDSQYKAVRQRLERRFSHFELVSLPDRVFAEAGFESALLVARDPRPDDAPRMITVNSAAVTDAAREPFLKGIYRPVYRSRSNWSVPAEPQGELWVAELFELWEYLADYPTLGSRCTIHRGLEWELGHQSRAHSRTAKAGFRLGVHSTRDLCQFATPPTSYLDARANMKRGNALDRPWHLPKVIVNASRKSRGPWRLAAVQDAQGLLVSQQLAGVWPKDGNADSLGLIEVLLNSPIASAFVSIHDARQRFRLETLERIPIPRHVNWAALAPLRDRVATLAHLPDLFALPDYGALSQALLQLDAELLHAYGLPPRLEQQLLSYVARAPRPVHGGFDGYPAADGMARSLREQLSKCFDDAKGGWIRDTFQPLPKKERDVIAAYLQ